MARDDIMFTDESRKKNHRDCIFVYTHLFVCQVFFFFKQIFFSPRFRSREVFRLNAEFPPRLRCNMIYGVDLNSNVRSAIRIRIKYITLCISNIFHAIIFLPNRTFYGCFPYFTIYVYTARAALTLVC